MSEEEGGEKSFDATPQRLKKARQDGNVPLSLDLNVFAAYGGLAISLLFVAGAARGLMETLVGPMWYPEELAVRVLEGGEGARAITGAPMRFLFALLALPMALVLLSVVSQQALTFAVKKVKPDLKRLSPYENAKKKWGGQGMSDFLRNGAKLILVGGLGAGYLFVRRHDLVQMFRLPATSLGEALLSELMGVLIIGTGVAFAVALIDVPTRRMAHLRKMRMTRQQVTDENKENEGDPQQKQNRRRRAQEFATNQMLRDVEKADVVVVNPTHYAVALLWDRDGEGVPTCVAKGVDALALTIIDRARTSSVPVREDPPCARALHATVKIGEPIRPEHYAAVAAAIRFAERARKSR